MNVVQKEIGAYIIGNLNENGYLETSVEELWRENPRYELETWHKTLNLIQNFDPKGVAARDLQECLLIQARSKKLKNNLVEKIIISHWNDFLHRKCDAIAKNLSVAAYDVHAVYSVIASFDPRPGQRFNKKVCFNGELSAYRDSVFHIKPDFYVYENGNGYKIEPEHFYIDRMINNYLYRKFENGVSFTQFDTERYLKIRDSFTAIYNRHKNLYLTIKSVVRLQKEFFDTGALESLKPLIARDVAEQINLDESTVRRIRKNKYIDTPHGIFNLEFFFDRVGIHTQDGRKIASKGVTEFIKDIIQSENKRKPYSDRQIAVMLRENKNLKIEPRTVGNHREKLGLLSARLRKWPC
jgi:RNA polymerase sigma-54 factor